MIVPLSILEYVGSAWTWLFSNSLVFMAGFVVILVAYVFMGSRRAILFEAWVDRTGDKNPNLGLSLADLLLHKIRAIQHTHEKSVRRADLWNKFYEVPVFYEGLDEDLKLLASVELGGYTGLIGNLIKVLFRLFPMIARPARLKGSIHCYGDEVRFFLSLEHYRPEGSGTSVTRVWEARGVKAKQEEFPRLVNELAYQVYLELTGADIFKSWEAFREYVHGLDKYLRFTDLPQDKTIEIEAEKLYIQALEREPSNPIICYNLAALRYFRYSTDENDQAISLFRTALRTTDKRLRAQALSGLTSALCQRYTRYRTGGAHPLDEAMSLGNEALKLNPGSAVVHKALAFVYHQKCLDGNTPAKEALTMRDLAIEQYELARKQNPRYHQSLNNYANLCLEWEQTRKKNGENWSRHQVQKCIDLCRAATELDSGYQFAYDNMGNAHFELENFAKAEECFNRAIQCQPDYAEAINDLAMLYLREDGRRTKAIEEHRRATAVVKNQPPRQQKLCLAFVERAKSLKIEIGQLPNPAGSCQCAL